VSKNSLNLQEINQEQSLDLTKFFIKNQQNMFLFGLKGTGKTSIFAQAIEQSNYEAININLSVIERSDLCGYPNLFDSGDTLSFKAPSFLPRLKDKKKASYVIVFDEVDKCSPDITAPLLEILQFKKINDQPLNIVSCLLTGNLMNEGAYSNQISTALLDRGAKYILNFDFNKWMIWAQKNNIHDLILAFLLTNQDCAVDKSNNTFYASPSPRGWSQASDALHRLKISKITQIENITIILSGFVGAEAATKFRIWYENFREHEPMALSVILTGKTNFKFLELPKTKQLVFIVSACYLAKQEIIDSKNKNKCQYLENLCKFFAEFKIDDETQLLAISSAFNVEIITKYNLHNCKVFFELFQRLNNK
jgi:hypothetical protein